MNIVTKVYDKILFGDIESGTVIRHKDGIFMKTVLIAENHRRFNVVDLSNGLMDFIYDEEYVIVVDCDLVLK